jgi:antitoxin component YwqK of YwqJK toxin-antitoxin module
MKDVYKRVTNKTKRFIKYRALKNTCWTLMGLLFLLAVNPSAGQVSEISVHKKSQVLKDGKKQTVLADCYYSAEEGTFVAHYLEPMEFVKITNRKGEMKIYFPKTNKVSVQQDFYFSSENELLHYFVNNRIDDLGLRKEGFQMSDSRYDENYLVTTWSPPQDMKVISKVELVFENMIPIYAAYFGKDGKILRKIYYSDYYKDNRLLLPKRITEITFTSEEDSTIKRTLFSDIRQNGAVDKEYMNFKIPDDAQITQ